MDKKKKGWKPVAYGNREKGEYYTFDTDHSNPFSVKGAAKKIKKRQKILDEI